MKDKTTIHTLYHCENGEFKRYDNIPMTDSLSDREGNDDTHDSKIIEDFMSGLLEGLHKYSNARNERERREIEENFMTIKRPKALQDSLDNLRAVIDANKNAPPNSYAKNRSAVIKELDDYARNHNKVIIDFENPQSVWYIAYDHYNDVIYTCKQEIYTCDTGVIYFDSYETAQGAINQVGEDRLKDYIFPRCRLSKIGQNAIYEDGLKEVDRLNEISDALDEILSRHNDAAKQDDAND